MYRLAHLFLQESLAKGLTRRGRGCSQVAATALYTFRSERRIIAFKPLVASTFIMCRISFCRRHPPRNGVEGAVSGERRPTGCTLLVRSF